MKIGGGINKLGIHDAKIVGHKSKNKKTMKDVGVSELGMQVSPAEPRNKRIYPSVHIDRPVKGLKIGHKVVMHGHVDHLSEDQYGSTARIRVKKMGVMEKGEQNVE